MTPAEIVWNWADPPVARTVIEQVAADWGIVFPDDYVACAMTNHGGRPDKKVFDAVGRRGAVFLRLLSYAQDPSGVREIVATYGRVREWFPPVVFPFARDPFGDFLCFDFRGGPEPTVGLTEHETDAPDGDFCSILPVCDSFGDLLRRLRALSL